MSTIYRKKQINKMKTNDMLLIGGAITFCIGIFLLIYFLAIKKDSSSNSLGYAPSLAVTQAKQTNEHDVWAAGITAGGGLLSSIVGLFDKND